MKANVGMIDKSLRIIVGIVLIALAAIKGGAWMWAYLGIIPLLTGLFGFCPAYGLLGMSTRGKSGNEGNPQQ